MNHVSVSNENIRDSELNRNYLIVRPRNREREGRQYTCKKPAKDLQTQRRLELQLMEDHKENAATFFT